MFLAKKKLKNNTFNHFNLLHTKNIYYKKKYRVILYKYLHTKINSFLKKLMLIN